MIVYRLEHEGYGIFSSDYTTFPTDSIYSEEGCTVVAARNGRNDREYRFGCDSIEKLIDYFGSDFAHALGGDGVELVAYKVRRNYVLFSDIGIEVAFKIEKAEKITI